MRPAAHLWHPPNHACTLLITALPGGLDRYFAELAAAVRQQDNQAVAAANEKFGSALQSFGVVG